MKFSIITFGCKVNQCESDNIRFSMIKNGYELSENVQNPDIIIINSCTVTAESDRKLRQTVNKIKKINPSGIIVLTGCMPQAFPEEAKKILRPYFNLMVSMTSFARLVLPSTSVMTIPLIFSLSLV